MSAHASIISRAMPLGVLILLAGVNLALFLTMPSTSQEDIWYGPPITGRRLALADAKIKEAPAPPVVQPVAPVAKAKPAPVSEQDSKGEYIVQTGGFFDQGIETVLERLRKGGLEPWVQTSREKVKVNSLQAGPFANKKELKEAEAQLKAAGIAVKVEESWEGSVIALGRSYALGEALQEMEKIRSKGVQMLRLVKVEEDRSVSRVCVGPYPSKAKANEASARVAKLSLTVPVVKEWAAPASK
ncbi:SPOR domain-containing protein [Candidatus Magnetaquicoccus inordinatus]|uniref:SPOR domain-containing protein n=1 Tax=Candidatus Magnetaquicoccus inordinatus TaxID=2496818 RepID=UPI00102B34E4|nr:SPOR domain-containing protein [Candidatus Magnetaquicoccus inordinatus]